jgi:hypothetical protein
VRVDKLLRNIPLLTGLILTAIWLFGVVIFLSRAHSFQELDTLELNEFGDFLAGISAPIAFLWLIVAVLMQRQELQLQRLELQHSRDVLKVQLDELRASAEQLDKQTKLITSQNESQHSKTDFDSWEKQLAATILEIRRLEEGRADIIAKHKGRTCVVPFATVFIDLEDVSANLPGAFKRAVSRLTHVADLLNTPDDVDLEGLLDTTSVAALAKAISVMLELLDPQSERAINNPRISDWLRINSLEEFASLSNAHINFLQKKCSTQLAKSTSQ